MKTHFDVLNVIMNAAVVDKAIPDNPSKAIRLSAILRGFSRSPKWVPTADDVLSLAEVVPNEYQAAIWLGAGEGLRLGEVLGFDRRRLQRVRAHHGAAPPTRPKPFLR